MQGGPWQACAAGPLQVHSQFGSRDAPHAARTLDRDTVSTTMIGITTSCSSMPSVPALGNCARPKMNFQSSGKREREREMFPLFRLFESVEKAELAGS